MASKKVAYSYVRFSRPEQLNGDSLRRQKEASKKWCYQNGYYLDESLKLTDKGVSAFRGDNAVKGKLGAFVDAIETGRVKKGSVLIVESLDRLSRQAASEAFIQLMSILGKGITIITLNPEEKLTQKDMEDTTKILSVILIMTRAYEESSTKSKRIKDAWENKRKKLQQGVIISGRVPGWIEKEGDRFVLNPHADTVKRIVKMYLAGHGPTAIVRALNADNVPTIGRGKQRANFWRQSSIIKILKSPALIGEFQPHLGKSSQDQSKRQPAGDPIPNYYPAIIKEVDFYKIKKRFADKRTSIKGRVGNGDGRITNLFRGLIFDERDKSAMIIVNKGTNASGRQIVSSKATADKTIPYIAFPYEALEESLFRMVSTITTADILPQEATDYSEALEAAQLRLGKLEDKITMVQQQILNCDPEDAEPLLQLIPKLNQQKNEAKIQSEDLQAKLHNSMPTQEECQSVVELMQNDKENVNEHRRRFRNIFMDIVKRVDVLPVKSGHWRLAYVRVLFDNDRKRTIAVICHRGKLVICQAHNGDFMDHENSTKEELDEFYYLIEHRFTQCKARSVKQTKINLENYYRRKTGSGIPITKKPKNKIRPDRKLYIANPESETEES